jgi:Uncharacterized conserved protein (DUF2190)
MSAYFQPKVLTFKADAAIPMGCVVKAGSDNAHVAKSVLATNKNIGIAQNAATILDDKVEVALTGGGAKGLAGGTIAFGDLLTSDANGALVATTTAGDRIVGIAMDAAVAGDLFSVEVSVGSV